MRSVCDRSRFGAFAAKGTASRALSSIPARRFPLTRFFTVVQRPADDIGVQLGCDRDRGEHIVVSEHCATSVRSVFAAGDITPGPQIAIRAAASGDGDAPDVAAGGADAERRVSGMNRSGTTFGEKFVRYVTR